MGVKKYFGEKPMNKPTPFKAQFGNEADDFDYDSNEESKPSFYPSPVVLAEYEEIQEGAADRILTLVENEQKKSEKYLADSIKAQSAQVKRGQLLFAFIALAIIASTIFLSVLKFIIPAAALGFGGMLLLTSLAKNNKKEVSENNKKSFSKPLGSGMSTQKPRYRRNKRSRRR